MSVDEEQGASLQWERPSPKLRTLRRLEVGAAAGLLLALALAISLAAGSGGAAIVAAACILVAATAADVMLGRRWRAWGYAERADDLLVKRGVMFRRLSVIPYGRMQYVEVKAGPLERSFQLATVQMHTAAAASDARIPGLAVAEAERLRDQLTSLGEAHAMGL